jgi:2-keto-4-pentenoate hydratase
MLMHTQASRLAHRILNSRAETRLITPLSADPALTATDAYEIARCILDDQIAGGETPVGRKIGFANRKIWGRYGQREPIVAPVWGTLYSSAVRYAEDNHGVQSLDSSLQPRVEPQIIFKLRNTPAPDAGLAEIADCLEWMAHGCEILMCPFPEWKFEAIDAIAAFGLHGTLIIGDQRVLSEGTRRNLPAMLMASSMSLSRSRDGISGICAAGFGDDFSGSPVHALLHLHRQLLSQPQFAPLAAGDIVSTGAWTDAYPVQAGETWMTAFSGVNLPGLTLTFV